MKSALICWIAMAILSIPNGASSQPSVSQSVFAVAGHSFSSPDVYLSSTLGESFIFGGSLEHEFMCQGFQSGLGVIITAVVQLDNGPQAVNLFPNPVSDFLQIEWESAADFTIQIHSAIGQRIMTVPVHHQAKAQIDFTALPPGLYVVSFQMQNGSTRLAGRIIHHF